MKAKIETLISVFDNLAESDSDKARVRFFRENVCRMLDVSFHEELDMEVEIEEDTDAQED